MKSYFKQLTLLLVVLVGSTSLWANGAAAITTSGRIGAILDQIPIVDILKIMARTAVDTCEEKSELAAHINTCKAHQTSIKSLLERMNDTAVSVQEGRLRLIDESLNRRMYRLQKVGFRADRGINFMRNYIRSCRAELAAFVGCVEEVVNDLKGEAIITLVNLGRGTDTVTSRFDNFRANQTRNRNREEQEIRTAIKEVAVSENIQLSDLEEILREFQRKQEAEAERIRSMSLSGR